MTKEEALNELKKDYERVKYKLIREPKSLLDKKVWFCVIYNTYSSTRSLEQYKKIFKRLKKGEKIKIGIGREAYIYMGYGKYLGMFDHGRFKQYVIYDFVVLEGEEIKFQCDIKYNVLHEFWIRLGLWASQFEKERVVFT